MDNAEDIANLVKGVLDGTEKLPAEMRHLSIVEVVNKLLERNRFLNEQIAELTISLEDKTAALERADYRHSDDQGTIYRFRAQIKSAFQTLRDIDLPFVDLRDSIGSRSISEAIEMLISAMEERRITLEKQTLSKLKDDYKNLWSRHQQVSEELDNMEDTIECMSSICNKVKIKD